MFGFGKYSAQIITPPPMTRKPLTEGSVKSQIKGDTGTTKASAPPPPPKVMGEWQTKNKNKQIVMPAKPKIRRDEFTDNLPNFQHTPAAPQSLIHKKTQQELDREWLETEIEKLNKIETLFPEAVQRTKDMIENSNIKEMVNGPQHYGGADNPYEVIKVCEAWGLDKDAYLFNVVKYVARAGKKDPKKELEDLKKAVFYLQRKVENLQK